MITTSPIKIIGYLPQFYKRFSPGYSAEDHGFTVINKGLKNGGRITRPPLSWLVILLGCRDFRAVVLTHIATQVLDGVDQDLNDVFVVVHVNARVLLTVLVVKGCP